MVDNYNGIPNGYEDIDVDSTVKKVDLADLGGTDVTGRRIWLRALTADITYLRGDHTDPGIAVGEGLVLASGTQTDPYYVDPAGETELTVIAGADDKVLRVFYMSG